MKIKFLLPLAVLLLAGCATQTYTATAPPPPGPTLAEVQSMVAAHVSDPVIISQIQNSSTRYSLTADQIISLKNAGVSDVILNALINTASKPVPQPATKVETEYYAYPYVYVDPWPWGWGWGPHYYGGWHGGYHHYGGGYHYRH